MSICLSAIAVPGQPPLLAYLVGHFGKPAKLRFTTSTAPTVGARMAWVNEYGIEPKLGPRHLIGFIKIATKHT